MSDDASLTITTDLERLALRDSIVVGGQPELSSGAERAEQRLELATRALQLATRVCGRDHLTRRRVLGLECRLVRTRGEEDELAAVSLVWSALRWHVAEEDGRETFETLLLTRARVRHESACSHTTPSRSKKLIENTTTCSYLERGLGVLGRRDDRLVARLESR